MACGLCGPGRKPTTYTVTYSNGETQVFLTETEARIAATQHGGGTITRNE